MAQFPNTIPTFSTKHNITDVVDESHPNTAQDEITAIAQELGVNPRISTALATTYANVDTRLEFIEANYRLLSNHEAHSALTGLAGDDHTQYIKVDGSRAFTGVAAITAAPVATQVGDTQSAGSAVTMARSDHRHAHAGGSPVASGAADTASDGVAVTAARSDHRHAREGFGAVTAETGYGQAASNGVAASVARSDHTHGTPALSSTTPSTQAMGDAAVIGVGTTAARADHKHAMPALGSTVVDETVWGLSSSPGSSAQASRADHTHGSPSASLTGPSGIIALWPTASAPGGWLICNGQAVSRTTYSVLFGIIGTTFGVGDGSTTFNLPDYRGRVLLGSGQGSGLTNRALNTTGGAETVSLALGEMPTHSHTVNSHSHGGSSVAGQGPSAHRHSYDHGHGYSDPGHSHGMGSNIPSWVNYGDAIMCSVGQGVNQVADYQLGAVNSRDILTYGHILSSGTGAWVNGTGYIETGTETVGLSHGHGLTIGAEAPGTNTQGSGTAHANMQPWAAINYIIKV